MCTIRAVSNSAARAGSQSTSPSNRLSRVAPSNVNAHRAIVEDVGSLSSLAALFFASRDPLYILEIPHPHFAEHRDRSHDYFRLHLTKSWVRMKYGSLALKGEFALNEVLLQ